MGRLLPAEGEARLPKSVFSSRTYQSDSPGEGELCEEAERPGSVRLMELSLNETLKWWSFHSMMGGGVSAYAQSPVLS